MSRHLFIVNGFCCFVGWAIIMHCFQLKKLASLFIKFYNLKHIIFSVLYTKVMPTHTNILSLRLDRAG